MCSSVHIHPFNKRKRSAKKAAVQLPNHFFRRQMIKKMLKTHVLIVKSIGPPSFDIILSWYLVAVLLPVGW
jgi:hypothetical protein